MKEISINSICARCNNKIEIIDKRWHCSKCNNTTFLSSKLDCPICFSPYYVLMFDYDIGVDRNFIKDNIRLCSNPNCPSYEVYKNDAEDVLLVEKGRYFIFKPIDDDKIIIESISFEIPKYYFLYKIIDNMFTRSKYERK